MRLIGGLRLGMIHFDVQSKAVSEHTGDTLLHLHQHLRLLEVQQLMFAHPHTHH